MNARPMAMVLLLAAAALGGCAGFDGRGLLAGQSSESEVVALMGAPSHRVALPNGDSALYFSRLPEGRSVYVVKLGPNGVMKSIEQRLVRANLRFVFVGTSTKKDVLELFGPAGRVSRDPRRPLESWEYKYYELGNWRVFWVQFSDDGVVRDLIDMVDWELDKPGALQGM